jgi:hypothetical protein
MHEGDSKIMMNIKKAALDVGSIMVFALPLPS